MATDGTVSVAAVASVKPLGSAMSSFRRRIAVQMSFCNQMQAGNSDRVRDYGKVGT
jgi:hypothetical protein